MKKVFIFITALVLSAAIIAGCSQGPGTTPSPGTIPTQIQSGAPSATFIPAPSAMTSVGNSVAPIVPLPTVGRSSTPGISFSIVPSSAR